MFGEYAAMKSPPSSSAENVRPAGRCGGVFASAAGIAATLTCAASVATCVKRPYGTCTTPDQC